MVCQACGTPVAAGVNFCSRCGVQIPQAQPSYAAYPPPPPTAMMYVPRVQRNLQTLGVLWCVLGVYRVVTGLVGVIFLRAFTSHRFDDSWMFGGRWHGPMMMPGWFEAVWPLVLVMTIVTAALALLAGFGLLNRRPWGRVLAIVAAILALLKFPFGTALGIYTLWVLASGASGLEYDSLADRS